MHFYINVAQVWGLGIITVVLGIAAYTVVQESKRTHLSVWQILSSDFKRVFGY